MSAAGRSAVVLAALLCTAPTASHADDARAVRIAGGTYRPMFPAAPSEAAQRVATFWLDRTPVTNAAFLAFVRAQPAWQRGSAKPLVVDAGYLAHWSGPAELGARARPRGPVVGVSWFAARAYCTWRGGRLPREAEWELAADEPDERRLLAWYAERAPEVLPEVGRVVNRRGVADLHGLVWEWIEDYSGVLVTADSRGGSRGRFCGGGAASAARPGAYATFMRLAFRSSLEGRYTTPLLGFRCAYDEAPR